MKIGITYSPSPFYSVFIPWNDIKNIRKITVTIHGTISNFIAIDLFDNEKYLNETSKMQKLIAQLNRNILCDSAIIDISLEMTGIKIDDFFAELIAYKENLEK